MAAVLWGCWRGALGCCRRGSGAFPPLRLERGCFSPELATVAPKRPACDAKNWLSTKTPETSAGFQEPIYTAPYFGSPLETIEKLDIEELKRALRVYGGLIRPKDDKETLCKRLAGLARRRRAHCIRGVVVSNAPEKTVVVAAQRARYERVLKTYRYVTRRFMAHDEENRCLLGDRVTIRLCRPLSRRKRFVVVENFGSAERRRQEAATASEASRRTDASTEGLATLANETSGSPRSTASAASRPMMP
jgi:small subunit ribosomal protein S17